MTIDEAIAREREMAEIHRNAIVPKEDYHNMPWIDKNNEASMRCAETHEQLAEWLEKLKYIENIILKWNADIYNDEDTGIPDNEILEAIFNACTGNGFDINIDEDFRQGYNKAIDDFVQVVKKYDWNIRNRNENEFIYGAIDILAEQLKAGGSIGNL